MTESRNNTKTWTTKQIWIKDVLNKSGTELMDISKTKTKAAIKKAPAKGKSFSGKLHTNFGPHSRLDAILFWYTKIGLWGEVFGFLGVYASLSVSEGGRERAHHAGWKALRSVEMPQREIFCNSQTA